MKKLTKDEVKALKSQNLLCCKEIQIEKSGIYVENEREYAAYIVGDAAYVILQCGYVKKCVSVNEIKNCKECRMTALYYYTGSSFKLSEIA